MWQEKLLAMLGVGIMGIEGKWCGRPRYFLKFSSIFLGDRRIGRVYAWRFESHSVF
jgi:hypothetical protein